ncbi:MAG: response regulator transcription factor [Bacillota bacterium]
MRSGELYRILIVDDEKLIRQGIKHYINWEQEGFQVIGEASNGQEALELLELTNPHIILTDIVMPIMDGEELTRIVKTKYPHIQIIILSSFGEFDYVRSSFQSGAVDYILKPKLDAQGLLNVLRTAASKIPSFHDKEKNTDINFSVGYIIDKLISGYNDDYNSEIISKVFPHSHFYLMGVDFKNHPSGGTEDFLGPFKEKIEAEIDEKLEYSVHHSFNFEQNVIVFLININKDKLSNLIGLANQMADSEPEIGFVISKGFTDFSQIGFINKEGIKEMLQYRFYFPEIKVLSQEDIPNEAPKCSSLNLDWFTNEMKHERFESAFGYLQEYVTALSGCYTTDVFEYKSFFENIIFNITILLGNMEYDVKELEKAKFMYFNSIDEASSAREAVDLLNRFIEESQKIILLKGKQSFKSNMKMILEYIEEHYADPLTLTGVANYFHFNPSYLSSYFTSNNSEGFIEYLNKIRIEEATKLLTNDKLSIAEISGIVGYSDHSYFCKVFKKIKGLSPSQYRRNQYMK